MKKFRMYMIYFNGISESSNYGHPEIRVVLEELYNGHWVSGNEVCSIIGQTSRDNNFSLYKSYAWEIRIPTGTYNRQIPMVKKLLTELLFSSESFQHPKRILELLLKHSVEKRSFMDVGRGAEHWNKEAVPVKFSQYAEAWYKARENGKNLTVTK